MARRWCNERANHLVGCLLAMLAVGVGGSASAQDPPPPCQPEEFLDRSAARADRELIWDLNVGHDPEHCMQVAAGQTVVWTPSSGINFSEHPLVKGPGGDTPNPITFHDNGSVNFPMAGTFWFVCANHDFMKGAIRVVAAPPPVPASSPWLAAILGGFLFASGSILLLHRRSRRATIGS